MAKQPKRKTRLAALPTTAPTTASNTILAAVLVVLRVVLPVVLLIVAAAGCSRDARLAEMAREAAQRQAEQNQEMARLNREVVANSQEVIRADAESRQEVLELQRELIQRDEQGRGELNALQRETHTAAMEDRRELDGQRQDLEQERRQIARQRYWDSLFGAALTSLGITLASLAPIGLAVYLLWALQHQGPDDAELADLLVEEIVSDRPMLLGFDRRLSRKSLPLDPDPLVTTAVGDGTADDSDSDLFPF